MRAGKYILILMFIALAFQACKNKDTETIYGDPNYKKGDLQLTCDQFLDSGIIPDSLSCKAGSNMRLPALKWSHVPYRTKGWAIIMDDTDAIKVVGHVWTHWVMYNIPPDADHTKYNALPMGTVFGLNSSGTSVYQGPCPPPGQTHHYTFRIFALSEFLDLTISGGANAAQIRAEMQGKVLDSAVLTGLFVQ